MCRSDLSPGLQAAQCCHAMREFQHLFPKEEIKWYNESNYLVLLETNNLEKIVNLANMLEIKCACFYEPDLNNLMTAIALEPGNKSKKLCSGLKLIG